MSKKRLDNIADKFFTDIKQIDDDTKRASEVDIPKVEEDSKEVLTKEPIVEEKDKKAKGKSSPAKKPPNKKKVNKKTSEFGQRPYYITDEQYYRIKELALKERIDNSAMVRKILDDYFEKIDEK